MSDATALVPDVRHRLEILQAKRQLLVDEYKTVKANMHRLVDHHRWNSFGLYLINRLLAGARELERLSTEIHDILDQMHELDQQRRIYQP